MRARRLLACRCYKPETDAGSAILAFDAVTPRDGAVKIPVVMTATAETAVAAGADVRSANMAATAGPRIATIGIDVLR
jgi:hypothetical protein